MKKIILICVLLCVLSMTACNQSHSEPTSDFKSNTYNNVDVELSSQTDSLNGEYNTTNEIEATQVSPNSIGSKTNYILGEKEHGFYCDENNPEYKAGYFYNIVRDFAVFMNSKTVEEKENETYKYAVHENGFAEIIAIKKQAETVEIPSNIDGYPIAYIGNNAFKYSNVKKVVLPDGILAIGEDAFAFAGSLKEVTFPNTLLAISAYAFEMCTSLSDIILPDSLQAIGEYAFDGCISLKEFKPPKDLQYVGFSAFSGCSNLSGHLSFGDKIKEIAASAFEGSAIQSVTIPQGAYAVGAGAFSECENLKKVELPKTMGDCENGLGWAAFRGCINLEEVNIPENLTGIASETFKNCRSLKSIKIPASVETILDKDFMGCYNLKDIYFESKDCSIYYNSFLLTPGLTIHAPEGGSVERFFKLRPLVKFEATV